MMIRRLCLALAASAALSAPVFAQTLATTPAQEIQFTSVPTDSMLSYNLIGLNVYNEANQNVGEIRDLVITRDKLDGYILSVGGFLGIGQHYVVVQPDSIAVSYDTSKGKWAASINATKEQLKAAPEFKYEGRWKAS
jgi:PRC-barrel domain